MIRATTPIIDSTGLSIVDEGEWAAAKHGGRGRRGWKKLHLGVARVGVIEAVREMGRRRWKKTTDYHRQARVENACFRYKSIIGGGLRARRPARQGTEAVLACNLLNQITTRGKPVSYAIGR
ncbi:MAG: hypothetical protein HQ485_02915 [Acidobacteria bacterium]|jgi:hypothetical protein|nr:hypothetical protein [Acidobacteriota bacterium]